MNKPFCEGRYIIKEFDYILNVVSVKSNDTVQISDSVNMVINKINCSSKSIDVTFLINDSTFAKKLYLRNRRIKTKITICDPTTGECNEIKKKYYILSN